MRHIKKCSICNEEKGLDCFYGQLKSSVNGEEYTYYQPYCKICAIEKAKISQQHNYHNQLERMRVRNTLPEVKEKRKAYLASDKWKNTFRKWQLNNKDKLREYALYRNMHKTHEISDQERFECKRYFNFECAYCGISEEESIEKYNNQLHMDHVDSNGANDLSNNIPACKSCNSSKGTLDILEWFENQSFYLEQRFEKILNWLNEDYKIYIKSR